MSDTHARLHAGERWAFAATLIVALAGAVLDHISAANLRLVSIASAVGVASLLIARGNVRRQLALLCASAALALIALMIALSADLDGTRSGWRLVAFAPGIVGVMLHVRRRVRHDGWINALLLLAAGGVAACAGTLVLERMPGQRMSGGDFSQLKGAVPQRELGKAFMPNATMRSYFDENPRGYFTASDAEGRRWHLWQLPGNSANLEYPPQRNGVRVAIATAAGDTSWYIQISAATHPVRAGIAYALSFRARAEHPRSIVFGVSRRHAPWTDIWRSAPVAIDTQWTVHSAHFQLDAADDSARLIFNFGGNASSVELSDIQFVDLDRQRSLEPTLPNVFAQEYRVDAFGCRRHVLASPDAGARHILLLGDAFAFGSGVHDDDMVGARLGQLLAAQPPSSPWHAAEVTTCAVPGYGTRQERRLADLVMRHRRYDLVLLSVSTNDDHLDVDESDSGYRRPDQPNLPSALVWRLAREQRSTLGASDAADAARRISTQIHLLAETLRTHSSRLVVLLAREGDTERWPSITEAVQAGAADDEYDVIDLGATIQSVGDLKARAVDFPRDRHANEHVHRAVADTVAQFLRARVPLVPPLDHARSAAR